MFLMIILEVAERDGGIAQTWIFFVKLLVLHNLRSHHCILIKYNIETCTVGGQILAAAKSEKNLFCSVAYYSKSLKYSYWSDFSWFFSQAVITPSHCVYQNTFGTGPLIKLEFFRECSKGSSLELNQAIDLHSRIPVTAGIKAFSLASRFPLDLEFFLVYFLIYTSFLLCLILSKSHYELWYILCIISFILNPFKLCRAICRITVLSLKFHNSSCPFFHKA